jgi:membrane associated rhomboid family serine protease/antitoxin component YwqK of YwqJK toxin-antitoxin module
MLNRQPVTFAIIGINVLIFAVLAWQQQSMLFTTSDDVVAILDAGGNFNPLTLGGQPWRIFTSMFLHFGVIHLLVNMYGLWQLGEFLEPGIGSARYAILYVICGLTAGVASLFFNVLVVSAGASGAIFGLYGFQLGAELISTYHDREKLKRVLLNFVIFVVINAFIAGQVRVDMSGHIGGLVAGLLIAFCHFKLNVLKSHTAMLAVLVAIPFLIFAAPKGQKRFYDIFQRVSELEQKTKSTLQTQNNETILIDSLKSIQREWVSVRNSFNDIGNVPTSLHTDVTSLRRFVDLFKAEGDYRLHVIDQTYIYLDSLETIGPRFAAIPKLQHAFNFNGKSKKEEPKDTTQHETAPALPIVKVSYDKDWKETDSVNALYYRIGTRDSAGRWQGRVRDYYKNGELQMKGAYSDGLRHGVFIYYSDRMTYTSAGQYEKDRSIGKWQTFHWNGRLSEEIFFSNNVYTESVWDSLGNKQVHEGNGSYKAWYANGRVREEGTYRNGMRTGVWYGYREDGNPYFQEEYSNNRLVRGFSVKEGGSKFMYDGLSLFPYPVMGIEKYRKQIEQKLQYPSGETKHGVAKIIFTVGVDGSLWDFAVLQSVSPRCDAEAIRLIKEGPPWRPALLHGQEKIQAQGYAEIRF